MTPIHDDRFSKLTAWVFFAATVLRAAVNRPVEVRPVETFRCRRIRGSIAGVGMALGMVGVGVGCETAPERSVATEIAARDHVVEGVTIDDVRARAGTARNPDTIQREGVFLIESPAELTRIWSAHATGRPPIINWTRDTVIGVFLTRHEVTGLEFYRAVRGSDATYVYVLGDTTPLTTPRYNFPFCVIVVPTRDRPIDVRLLYMRRRPTGEVDLYLRGPRARFTDPAAPIPTDPITPPTPFGSRIGGGSDGSDE